MVTTFDEPQDPEADQEQPQQDPEISEPQTPDPPEQEPVENFRRGMSGPPTPEEVAGTPSENGSTPPEEPDPTQPIGRQRNRRPRREEHKDVTTSENTEAAPPGRPSRRRGAVQEEPQTSFAEERIDVEEDAGLKLLAALEIRDANRESASAYNKADRDVKEELKRRGYYDGQPHELRVDRYLLTIAPSDGEAKEISFERQPPIRVTIQRQD